MEVLSETELLNARIDEIESIQKIKVPTDTYHIMEHTIPFVAVIILLGALISIAVIAGLVWVFGFILAGISMFCEE